VPLTPDADDTGTESDDPNCSEVYFDTSVLLNFVLDSDGDSEYLLLRHDCLVVIGEKVEEEFGTVPERRKLLYEDMAYVVSSGESAVEDYVPNDDLDLTSNDKRKMREVAGELAGLDDAEVLRRLREREREIGRRESRATAVIDEVVSLNDDLELQFALNRVIDNEDDCQVIADAVGWRRDGGTGTVTSSDAEDIVFQREEINDKIRDCHDEDAILSIHFPDQLVEHD
jgi:hypothetical protein